MDGKKNGERPKTSWGGEGQMTQKVIICNFFYIFLRNRNKTKTNTEGWAAGGGVGEGRGERRNEAIKYFRI